MTGFLLKSNKFSKIIMVMILSLVNAAPALTSLPQIKMKKVSANILVLSVKDTNMTVLALDQGLAVIDTLTEPGVAKAARDMLRKKYPGKRILYVINTHGDWDHVNGNQVFKDRVIIGHQGCEKWMSLNDAYKVVNGLEFVPPDIAFRDRLNIKIGHIILHLIHVGRLHTQGDIVIYVPRLQLLVVGDLFFKNYPPALNTHTGKWSVGRWQVDRWFKVFDYLVKNRNKVKHVISGHGPLLQMNDIKLWLDYLKQLFKKIVRAKKNNILSTTFLEKYKFQKEFSRFKRTRVKMKSFRKFAEKVIKKYWNQI